VPARPHPDSLTIGPILPARATPSAAVTLRDRAKATVNPLTIGESRPRDGRATMRALAPFDAAHIFVPYLIALCFI
jgi:hypothetical protein